MLYCIDFPVSAFLEKLQHYFGLETKLKKLETFEEILT